MQLIVYEGWPVALARADGVHLHPALLELAELEAGHGLVRFAYALALHAFEVKTGLKQGPFDQGRAERFARALLMPTEDFLALADQSDAELAGRFGRADRADPPRGAGSPPVGEQGRFWPASRAPKEK